MGSEDRLHGERVDGRGQPLRAQGLRDLGHRGGEMAFRGRARPQTADPMNLLGAVGQLEIGGEGANQVGGGVDGQRGQDAAYLLGGGRAIER